MIEPAIAVDFESYYDAVCSVTELGAVAYTYHPKFDAYLVSFAADANGQRWTHVCDPRDFDWASIDGLVWISHNAQFDRAVFAWLQRTGLVPAHIRPAAWHCTAALSRYHQGPGSLQPAVSFWFGRKISKAVRDNAKGVTPDAMRANKANWEAMLQYASVDAEECLNLWNLLAVGWPEWERRLANHTAELGLEGTGGIAVDEARVDDAIEKLKLACWKAAQDLPWMKPDWEGITEFRRRKKNKREEPTPLSPMALGIECRRWAISPPASLSEDSPDCELWEQTFGLPLETRKRRTNTVPDDEGEVAEAETDEPLYLGPTVPWVGAMRHWRKSNTLLQKFETIKRRLVNGFFYPDLIYCGTHTRRWAGGGGVNMQNLPQNAFDTRYPAVDDGLDEKGKARKPPEDATVDLRAVFVPSDGFKMYVPDLSQIEARVTLWLAGAHKTLKLIAGDPANGIKGQSPYEAHARATMGWTRKENPKDCTDDEAKTLYKLAKARVLGLGFGCGPAKFVLVAKLMAGLTLSKEESAAVVADYRDKNPEIVALWKRLNNDFTKSQGGTYTIGLPSGNILAYRNVTRVVEPDSDGKVKGQLKALVCNFKAPVMSKLYGGKLTENLVQATARDLFGCIILALADAGFRILWHVHDEVVIEAPEGELHRIESIMSTAPDWAGDFPLAAEGKMVDAYCK